MPAVGAGGGAEVARAGNHPATAWLEDGVRFTSGPEAGRAAIRGVCAPGPEFDNVDALGNECDWSGCGYETNEVNDYFGGCLDNPTAGVLCCAG
ncbi:MAG: hypothetical protein ACI8PZ_006351 [Myxococcota bacterium]